MNLKKTLGYFLVVALPVLAWASWAYSQNKEPDAKEPYMLTLFGYNYTDRAVAFFSVNGQGGGDVNLSTPTSGLSLDHNSANAIWLS